MPGSVRSPVRVSFSEPFCSLIVTAHSRRRGNADATRAASESRASSDLVDMPKRLSLGSRSREEGSPMRGRRIRFPAAIVGALLLLGACTNGDDNNTSQTATSLLETVKSRGRVICGVNNQIPGFGFATAQGTFEGFDIEFCKVLAAAVLGDATKVDYKPLTTEQRFTALQAREVDVLIRNTTWSATRDGSLGAAFATPTFYDGGGLMVRADSNFRDVEDLNGATICVSRG